MDRDIQRVCVYEREMEIDTEKHIHRQREIQRDNARLPERYRERKRETDSERREYAHAVASTVPCVGVLFNLMQAESYWLSVTLRKFVSSLLLQSVVTIVLSTVYSNDHDGV